MSRSDGMFHLRQPGEPLRFTGERLTSAVSGGVEMEHLHRYCFARDLCVDLDVLDVASGEGYGAAMLAGVARSVIGVERDVEAVEHARLTYRSENLRFEVGDALNLALADGSVDVIVSFETFEHLSDQAHFLTQVKRVLRPGGLLLLSTPDRHVHSGLGMPVNPHHILELSRPELEKLLAERFVNVSVLAQRTLVGSVLVGAGSRWRTYERRNAVTIEATSGVARAVYLVAAASDGPLPKLPESLYADERSVDALLATIDYERGETTKARIEADRLFHAEAAARREAERLQGAVAKAEQDAGREADRLRGATVTAEQDTARRGELAHQATMEERDRALAERDDIAAQRDLIAAERDDVLAHRDLVISELAALRKATGVRLGLYATRRLSLLPEPVRRLMGRTLRAGLRARSSLRGSEASALPTDAVASHAPPTLALAPPSAARSPATSRRITALLADRYPSLQPFPCFQEDYPRPRLSIVTDSIGPSSLFGGVGTSILLGALLADRLGATLRIVTRTEPPDASAVRDVLTNNGLDLDGIVEAAFAPLDGSRDLPICTGEVFLTTSWWNTRATLGSVRRDRVIALVQEDERMFYPHGDDRLRCAETLSEPGIPVVVNTELLFRHLITGQGALANLQRDGLWFDPAFPSTALPAERGDKRRLFFYARPQNMRNLFWRGVEVLDLAVAEGLFPPDRWEMHWVGRDVPDMALARGVVPIRTSGMRWGEYQSFIASMDAGFVLMDTPHPSYPPLDLAAAGAAVLTNVHPGKETLDGYSRNILMAPSTRNGLLEGLRELQALGENEAARAIHRAQDNIGRDWTRALEPVLVQLGRRFAV